MYINFFAVGAVKQYRQRSDQFFLDFFAEGAVTTAPSDQFFLGFFAEGAVTTIPSDQFMS